MPAKSAKQYRMMQAIAHGMSNKSSKGGGVGPSKKVAEEFISETPKEKRRLFSKKRG